MTAFRMPHRRRPIGLLLLVAALGSIATLTNAYPSSTHRDPWAENRAVLLHRTLGAVAHPGPDQAQWAFMEVCVRKSFANLGGLEQSEATAVATLEHCRSQSTLSIEQVRTVIAPVVEVVRPDPREATVQQLNKVNEHANARRE